MTRMRLPVVTTVALLLASGCYTVNRMRLPEATHPLDHSRLRGIVLEDGAGGKTIEFYQVSEVSWTTSEMVVTAVFRVEDGSDESTTMSFHLEDVRGVLFVEEAGVEGVTGGLAGTALGLLASPVLFFVSLVALVG